MALYVYHCDECGDEFERLQRITDDSIPKCESCGSAHVHKVPALSAVHFKGTGWYVTDYKKKDSGGASHPKHRSSSSAKSSDTGSAGTTSSDSGSTSKDSSD